MASLSSPAVLSLCCLAGRVKVIFTRKFTSAYSVQSSTTEIYHNDMPSSVRSAQTTSCSSHPPPFEIINFSEYVLFFFSDGINQMIVSSESNTSQFFEINYLVA